MPKNANQQAKAKAAAKGGNNKQAKQLAKQLGQQLVERATKEGGRDNPYLKCLLNPEQWQSSYPDNYGEKTAVCKFVTNRTLSWDGDGNYWVAINPTLPDHILTKPPLAQTAGTYAYVSMTNYFPPTIVKVGPGAVLALSEAKGAKDLIGNTKSLPSSGSTLLLPKAMTAAGELYLANSDAGTAWSVSFTDSSGGLISTSVVTAGNPVPTVVPQTAYGLSVTVTTASGVVAVNSLKISLSLAEPASASGNVTLPIQNYSDIVTGVSTAPIFEEVRVVGMSALLTYEGDTLYNGGNITGRVVSGGDTAMALGWMDYASIASLPDSYESPLTLGAYGYWVPTDTKDMQFHEASLDNSTGDLPSLVFAGVVRNVNNAVIRLRTCTVIEAKTYKPYISTSYSMVAPELIDAAAVALRGIPRVMENPLHLDDIKDFLKKVVAKGKAVWDMGAAVAPVVSPLAQTLGAFLL